MSRRRRHARDSASRALAPAAGPAPMQVRNSYEAGAQTPRTAKWFAPGVTPNSALLGNLTILRNRSRAAVRNDGVAASIIDKLVSNIVGTGIKPLSQAADPDFRRRLHIAWARWTDESDADGLLDFYGQQSQAARSWLEGGDCYARLRFREPKDGLSVPIQVQILEAEMCPHIYNAVLANGNRVRAGIEFDLIGRRVAYYFYSSRPGDLQDYDLGNLRRVSADMVAPIFNPLRPGQLRGLPRLTQALIKLYELDKYDDATLLRQQLANMIVAYITRPAATGDEAALHPMTGEPIVGAEPPTISMEPGTTQELAPGESMEFSKPAEAGNGYADFMRVQLAAACVSAGVPYEVVTGDMRGLNDRTMRLIVNEFRRQIQASQHQILAFQFCRPIFRAWLDRAFLSGALPMPAAYLTDPEPWAAVKWMPPKWAYIHPVQDVLAQKDAIRNGFTSRQAVVAENGEDAEAIDAEQIADNARADAGGLQYDSDGRHGSTVTERVAETALPPTPDPAAATPPAQAPTDRLNLAVHVTVPPAASAARTITVTRDALGALTGADVIEHPNPA